MTSEGLHEFAKLFFQENLALMRKKNADYTGAQVDALGNFKAVEGLGISAEAGMLARMMDKMMRVATFIKKGELQVKAESVQDTLADLSNYSMLLAALIAEKTNAQSGH